MNMTQCCIIRYCHRHRRQSNSYHHPIKSSLLLLLLFVLGFKPLYRRHAADSLTVDLTSPLELSLYNPIPDDSSNAALLLFRTDFPTTIEDGVETHIIANMLGTSQSKQTDTHNFIHKQTDTRTIPTMFLTVIRFICQIQTHSHTEVMEQLRTEKQLGYTAGASMT